MWMYSKLREDKLCEMDQSVWLEDTWAAKAKCSIMDWCELKRSTIGEKGAWDVVSGLKGKSKCARFTIGGISGIVWGKGECDVFRE